jgi:hypothetical protein
VSRSHYKYLGIKPNGGINESEDGWKKNQLRIARNAWAPRRVLEQRPGYTGVTSTYYSDYDVVEEGEDLVLVGAKGTVFTQAGSGLDLTLHEFGDRDRWYFGLEDPNVDGVAVEHTPQKSNMTVTAEYCDESGWSRLGGAELTSSGSAPLSKAERHLGGDIFVYNFAAPQNWAKRILDDLPLSPEKYWIRFTLRKREDEFFKGSSVTEQIDNVNTLTTPPAAEQMNVRTSIDGVKSNKYFEEKTDQEEFGTQYPVKLANPKTIKSSIAARGLFIAQFPNGKRYISVRSTHDGLQFDNMASLDFEDLYSHKSTKKSEDIPPSAAIIPQSEEMYIAYGGVVTRHSIPFKTAASDNNEILLDEVEETVSEYTISADVDQRESVVGKYGVYSTEYITTGIEDDWPEANLIAFQQNRFWCVEKKYPHILRWSAPFPYHKVWPKMSGTVLFENDNSPITAITEHFGTTIVFKQDSIWSLKYMGQTADNTDLDTYVAHRSVAGIGAVAHRSIQSVEGRLLFMSEDGIYAYNGGEAAKLSLRIQDTIDRINPSRRAFATSCHWRRKNCYLLSVALDDSTHNNATICFDYRNNAFWVWDGFDVADWIVDENQDDDEVLYFVKGDGDICSFDAGSDDFGAAINIELETHRLGKEDGRTRNLRLIEVAGSSAIKDIDIHVSANDGLKGSKDTKISFLGGEKFNDGRFGSAVFPPLTMARRRVATRITGQWIQLNIKHSATGVLPEIHQIDLGLNLLGRR